MKKLVQRLEQAPSLDEALALIEGIVQTARSSKSEDRGKFLHALLFNPNLNNSLETGAAIDHLLNSLTPEQWDKLFGATVAQDLPELLVYLLDQRADVHHLSLLRLLPPGRPQALLASLKAIAAYLDNADPARQRLDGMRASLVQAEIYRRLNTETGFWKRRTLPPCVLDSDQIARLKQEGKTEELPLAYETQVNHLQREDLHRNLAALHEPVSSPLQMRSEDAEQSFLVRSPLRLGISSANASDNHIRSKEQGGKTLNAGIDLSLDGNDQFQAPLQVTARRLSEPKLLLRSLSLGFDADFELHGRGDAATQSGLFFAYRRGGDEALRLVKQALVHSGIVADNSVDVLKDITTFTGGGGLEITTQSRILQGSGLGTSSILAAAILKVLYRLTGDPASEPVKEYPRLYDQSVLLEQSLGLNSGWQDARGACGGTSAVKDFYAPPTGGLPTPQMRFVTVDAALFSQRILLFDTGISRAATRGLNVVLDAYLSRDPDRYAAIRQSLSIHDEMVGALEAADYTALGRMTTRYWRLRCTLDPEASSGAIQYLFEAPELAELSEGGMLTGAGGGGFGLIVAREGCTDELRRRLDQLKKQAAYARSGLVDYRLNADGLRLDD
jgi:galactokinase/mevalonate kinase-like predicted kinase